MLLTTYCAAPKLGAPGGRRAATIELGGTRLELIYVGRNHSDNSLVMLLPKYEKWGNYNTWLFGNVERFCEYWGRGI